MSEQTERQYRRNTTVVQIRFELEDAALVMFKAKLQHVLTGYLSVQRAIPQESEKIHRAIDEYFSDLEAIELFIMSSRIQEKIHA